MKKLSVITILHLCLFICISSAQAIPIMFDVTGKVTKNEVDPFVWDGQTYHLISTIDSAYLNKEIGTGPDNTGYTLYNGIFPVTLSVGETAYNVIGYDLYLGKGPDIVAGIPISELGDFLRMEVRQASDNFSMNIFAGFPFCYFGSNFPLAVPSSIRLEDATVQPPWGWVDIDGQMTYSLSVNTMEANPIPEPATMLLLGTGLVGLAVIGRKRFKNNR